MKKDTRKPVTIIAELKRANNTLRDALATATFQTTSFRARATKAEQECSEWKRRFDLLLARTPEVRVLDASSSDVELGS